MRAFDFQCVFSPNSPKKYFWWHGEAPVPNDGLFCNLRTWMILLDEVMSSVIRRVWLHGLLAVECSGKARSASICYDIELASLRLEGTRGSLGREAEFHVSRLLVTNAAGSSFLQSLSEWKTSYVCLEAAPSH